MSKPADNAAAAGQAKLKPFYYATLYGIASLGLYFLLFLFNDEIRQMAEATSRGDKSLFFVPIIIAFIFSIVHGAYTGYFWEALGISAKKK